jgi:CarboxypepD_reg-like domain/Secretion system C-terminal sorting domain
MKEQTYFHIPTPCHENWDNMTPEGKGRFCGSCSKQVVDFSLMSDQQVLNYFKQSTGSTCGRFANDQLQRAMLPGAEHKKKTWWIAAIMPLLLLFGKVNAQKKKAKVTQGEPAMVITDNRPEIMGKVAPEIRPDTSVTDEVIVSGNCYRIMGDTILSKPIEDLIIRGTVADENGIPLPFVSVLIKNSNKGTSSDANGSFMISLKGDQKLPTLILSYVGYASKEIDLNKEDSRISSSVQGSLKEILVMSEMTTMQPMAMGEVVITAGVIVRCRKPKKADTLKTTVNKIFKREQFKIFPNPAQSGSSVQLEIQKAGDYSIQILDNNAKLILVKKMETENDKTLTEIIIPYDVTPGMYYIVLIDEKKKKQYTDKLIVQ